MSKKKFSLCVIVMIALIQKAFPSNYVTVATIGTKPNLYESIPPPPQQIVNEVIGFWREKFQQVIPDKPDLIILTENCDYPQGLSNEQKMKYFLVRKNQVLDYFASVARENHCYIVFGMERELGDLTWRNSSILLDRNGKIVGSYNKNFPAIYELNAGIKAGNKTPVFTCDFGRVASILCFDLNFDELRYRYASLRPDIIVFSSMYHGGDALQSIWAYSCRSFFISSTASKEIPSVIINPLGEKVASNSNYSNFVVARINLDYQLVHLDYNFEKLCALKEKYGREVKITDPGKLGAVMVTSEHENLTASDMVKEFHIELLDDYFDRARKLRFNSIGKEE